MQEMPAPALDLPREHPRLGGWADVADDTELAKHSRWAAANLPLLVSLEQTGLRRAQGDVLVHFDLYPHNILLVPQRVWFVDWPHARFGSALVDLVLLLSSVAADGLDPEPFVPDSADPEAIDGILAAHTGALVGSSLHPPPPGLEPIFHTKLAIGLSALGWLRRRIRA